MPAVILEISVSVIENQLFVIVETPPGTERQALTNCMHHVAAAFAEVEGCQPEFTPDLTWQERCVAMSTYYVARREFIETDYPRKFDSAFRRLRDDYCKRQIN